MPEFDDSPVFRRILRQRAQVLARDDATIRELTRRWLQVERSLSSELAALSEEARRLHKEGLPIEAVRQRIVRLESLQRQVYRELNDYGEQVADLVTENQRMMAALAGQHTAQTLDAVGAMTTGFNQLPAAAFQSMVGHVAEGAPLYDYFIAGLPQKTVEGIMTELARGLALGWNPKKTAVAMRDAAAIGHRRALLISRTETLRAYRLSSLANYRESSAVQGWVWACARQPRTCMACIAKDGSIHELSEEFVDHPRGRCAAIPYIPNRPIQWTPARQWFKEQPADVQQAMMGKRLYTAWRGKKIGLDDIPQAHKHPTFGTHYGVASLEQAMENARRRGWAQP